MKKQILLFPVALLVLASCNENNSSSGANSGSGQVADTKISLNAVKSLFGSLTVDGTSKMSYESYSNTDEHTLHIELSDEKVEIVRDKESMLYVNVEGYVGGQYLDQANTVQSARFNNTQGGYFAWDSFFGTDLSSLKVSDFSSTSEENVYEVKDADVKVNLAKGLTTELLFPYDSTTNEPAKIGSMLVTVSNDVISNVSFRTENYDLFDSQRNMTFVVCSEFNFAISAHGTTVVKDEVTPYETYPEAAVLNEAFASLGNNVKVKYVQSIDDQVYEQNYYYLEDLYYMEDVASGENLGIFYKESINSLVRFSVDSLGKASADMTLSGYTFESSGLKYFGGEVAAEMFEFKEGKYVTRNEEDAQTVASYLCIDETAEYATELFIELDNGTIVITYSVGLRYNNGDEATLNCRLEVSPTTRDVVNINLDELSNYIDLLSTVPETMFGTFNSDEHELVINEVSVILDEKEFVVTSVKGGQDDGVIEGTVDGQNAKLEYGMANNLPAIQVTIGEDSFVLSYDTYVNQLVYIFNLLGLQVIPQLDGTSLYLANINYWETYGYIIFQFEPTEQKGSFTETDLTAYVNSIIDNDYFIDISSMDSSEVFVSGIAGQTVAEYLDASMVITDFDANGDLYLLAFSIYEGSIIVYLY